MTDDTITIYRSSELMAMLAIGDDDEQIMVAGKPSRILQLVATALNGLGNKLTAPQLVALGRDVRNALEDMYGEE